MKKECGLTEFCEQNEGKEKCVTWLAYQSGREDALKELMVNLDGDISAYANAGHGLDVYEWLKSYVKDMIDKEE